MTKSIGWVYFAAVKLKHSYKRAIKIGWSDDVSHRMDGLRSDFASVTFLGARRGSMRDERATHKRFAAFLLKKREIFFDVQTIRRHVFQTCEKRSLKSCPSKTEQVGFRISRSVADRLDLKIKQLTEETPGIRISRSEIARMAMVKYLRERGHAV